MDEYFVGLETTGSVEFANYRSDALDHSFLVLPDRYLCDGLRLDFDVSCEDIVLVKEKTLLYAQLLYPPVAYRL
jgi:hypothetical protein